MKNNIILEINRIHEIMGTKIIKESVGTDFLENLVKLLSESTSELKKAGKLGEKEFTNIYEDLAKLGRAASDDEITEILETIAKKSPEISEQLSDIVVKSLSPEAQKGLNSFKNLLNKNISGKDLAPGVKKMSPDMAQKNIDTFIEKNVQGSEVVKKYVKEDLEKYVNDILPDAAVKPKPEQISKVKGINNRPIKGLSDQQIKKYEKIWNAKGFTGKFVAALNKFIDYVINMFKTNTTLMDEASSIVVQLMETEPQNVGQIEALSNKLNDLYVTIANKEKSDFKEIKTWLDKNIKPIDYKLYTECTSKKGYKMAENIVSGNQKEAWVKEYGDLRTRRKKLLEQLVQVANPVDWIKYKGTFVKKWYDLLFSSEFKELRSEILGGQTKSLKGSADYIKYFGLPKYMVSVGKEWLYGYIIVCALEATYDEIMDFVLQITGLMNSLNFDWVKKRRETYKQRHPGEGTTWSWLTDFLGMVWEDMKTQRNITPGLIDNIGAIYKSFRDGKFTNETVEKLKELKTLTDAEKLKIEGIARVNGIKDPILITYYKEFNISDENQQLQYSVVEKNVKGEGNKKIILCQSDECNQYDRGEYNDIYYIPETEDGKTVYYFGFGKTNSDEVIKSNKVRD